jgi:hypothetical protein
LRVARGFPLGLDLAAELLDAERLHQDLDPRLVHVVAAAMAVVHAQDRLDIREHLVPGQELADHEAQERRAAHAAAHDHAQPYFAGLVADGLEPDVVEVHGGTVALRTVDRDLELARQVGELGMEGGPLAQDLGEGRGSTISSGATPAKWSVVILRTQLPEVWMACISTWASSARMSASRQGAAS